MNSISAILQHKQTGRHFENSPHDLTTPDWSGLVCYCTRPRAGEWGFELASLIFRKGISEEDYDHAQKVWRVFNCKTIGDYMKIYCKADTLILAGNFFIIYSNSTNNLHLSGLLCVYYDKIEGL